MYLAYKSHQFMSAILLSIPPQKEPIYFSKNFLVMATTLDLFLFFYMNERDNYRLHFNDIVSESETQLTTKLTHALT